MCLILLCIVSFSLITPFEWPAKSHVGRKVDYVSLLQIWLGFKNVALGLIKNDGARIPWGRRVPLHMVHNCHSFFLARGGLGDQNPILSIHKAKILLFNLQLRQLILQIYSFLHFCSRSLLVPFNINALEKLLEFVTIVEWRTSVVLGLRIAPRCRKFWFFLRFKWKAAIGFMPQLFMAIIKTFVSALRITRRYELRLFYLYMGRRYKQLLIHINILQYYWATLALISIQFDPNLHITHLPKSIYFNLKWFI